MICAYRSTRGAIVSAVSNGSAGSGRSSVFSNAQSWPTLVTRLLMRRASSASSAASNSALSSSIESTTGMGTQWLRRNRPPSPSTPPFSWLPSCPGWQYQASNRSANGTHPALVLLPRAPEQHLLDRAVEVVIADLVHWDPTQAFKRMHVPLEERLLPLGQKRLVRRTR